MPDAHKKATADGAGIWVASAGASTGDACFIWAKRADRKTIAAENCGAYASA
jgi:hypothetical protein